MSKQSITKQLKPLVTHLGGLGGTSCEELLRSNNKPYFVGQTFATYKKITNIFMPKKRQSTTAYIDYVSHFSISLEQNKMFRLFLESNVNQSRFSNYKAVRPTRCNQLQLLPEYSVPWPPGHAFISFIPFTHSTKNSRSHPQHSVQTDNMPIWRQKNNQSKGQHLPEKVKQQCNPFPLCYAHLYKNSAICRYISLLFHHCLKLGRKNKSKNHTVKFLCFFRHSLHTKRKLEGGGCLSPAYLD